MRLRKSKYKNAGRYLDVSKRYKLLGTSWKVQTEEFFRNSTLHGVRYIAEKDRPFLERFIWFICVSAGAVATVVIIMSLWEKFQTNPTITGLDTDFHNWEVPFPAVILCQDFPSNVSIIREYAESKFPDADIDVATAFLSKLVDLSFVNLKNFRNYTKENILKEEVKIKEVIFELMNKCEDIFESCEWKSKTYNCCEGFFPVFTERGFCYSFNSRHYENKYPGSDEEFPSFHMHYIKETDMKWSLSFKVKNTDINMQIFILNSDETAGLDVLPQHVWDYQVGSISFSVKQTYTTSDTKQLSIKQRHCVFSDEIKLNIDHIYTFAACTRQCRMDAAVKKCGCVPHWYPATDKYKHCSLQELSCIIDNVDEIVKVDKCSCQLGCSNTIYEVEKLNQNNGMDVNIMEAEFVSWPMVRYKREVLFGWVDLLVSFGGIAGLFLGFSLLSGVEILYYFSLRVCCMVVKERNTLEKYQEDEKLKPRGEYDLSLVPYFISPPLPGYGINEVLKDYYANNMKLNRVQPWDKHWKSIEKPVYPPFGIEFIN